VTPYSLAHTNTLEEPFYIRKMEATDSTKMSALVYQTPKHHITKEDNYYIYLTHSVISIHSLVKFADYLINMKGIDPSHKTSMQLMKTSG
jgi:hypothetical protein